MWNQPTEEKKIQCLKNLNFSDLKSNSASLFGYPKLIDFNRRRNKLKTNE